jgi:Mn2+/Fe2+ NRAMP family transporter
VSLLVLRGSFHRVEHVLLALTGVFVAYILSGFLAHPDWTETAKGLVVPGMPLTREAVLVAVATLGTTLAPWGLAFIQSYAVDKRLTIERLRWTRVEVATGAAMTGVIGFFVIVACAATLHEQGRHIHDAADAAVALRPLAGSAASALFAVGLIGAALLAASILPLATAYSVCEGLGVEATLDDGYAEARVFYIVYAAVVALAAGIVLVPGAPLVGILYGTQVLNAVLLLPIMAFTMRMGRDRQLLGEHATGRLASLAQRAAFVLVVVCVGALGIAALR